jgi:ribosomal protein S6
MLDPEVADADRDKVVSDVRAQIESGGTLEQADNWGMRKMAYEIRQRNEADYRFFRFQGDNALLEGLDHNLKIVDAALRFRIFKVDPEAPTAAPPVSGSAGPGASERGGAPEAPSAPPPSTPAPPAPAEAAATPAEAPAAPEAPAEAPAAETPPEEPPAESPPEAPEETPPAEAPAPSQE